MASEIEVEVVYVGESRTFMQTVTVPAGTRARACLKLTSLANSFPDIELDVVPLGIYGKKVADDQVLKAGDRLEVYRPLIIDPKQARRERALKKR